MMEKLNCILLIDDSDADNFLHQNVIEELNCTNNILICHDGSAALKLLTSEENGVSPNPDMIFLDINMPVMNGWEFLDKYNELSDSQKGGIIISMLTTSINDADKQRAESYSTVNEYMIKPLNKEGLQEILKKYFPNQFN